MLGSSKALLATLACAAVACSAPAAAGAKPSLPTDSPVTVTTVGAGSKKSLKVCTGTGAAKRCKLVPLTN